MEQTKQFFNELMNDDQVIQEMTAEIAPVNAQGIPELTSVFSEPDAFVEPVSDSNMDAIPEEVNDAILLEEKTLFTAPELIAFNMDKQPYLLAPVFPQKGTAVIAGKPGIGKSMLARQFCIHVANGLPSFMDLELKTIHKSAIYVSTEDSAESTAFSLNRQQSGLGLQIPESLIFLFAENFSQGEIISRLDELLAKKPADLVVVDSFGDVFTGSDSNNNIEMRRTVRRFSVLSHKHNCLILFVHHINKGAYNMSPSQDHIQGGGGLVQKVRLAAILSEGDGPMRYFSVVKGNYTPKEYREKSIELFFDENTFLFTASELMVSLSHHDEESAEERESLFELASEILANNCMLHKDLVSAIIAATNKSTATAKRYIKNMTDEKIINKTTDGYVLTVSGTDNTIFNL
ncbi:MAG: Uncharacterized protein FD155_3360 [Bacteroidetes bacterium]|nr:MAG: Uncharacterized protein FD155_3360 [Bacteroidota bacterium]